MQVKQLVEGGILKDVKFDIIIDDGLHYFPVNYNVMKILLPLVNKLSLSRSLRRERLSVLNSTAFRPHTHSPGHRLKEESQPWRPPNLHRVHILSNQFGDQLQIRSQQSKEPRLCL